MKFLKTIFILSILLITACTDEYDNTNSYSGDFFVGSQGVRMDMARDSPPYNVYYYSTQFIDGNDVNANSFPITIELDNEGVSDTLGFVVIDGFNHDFIYIPGMDPDLSKWNECWWADIVYDDTGGREQLSFAIGCSNQLVGVFNTKDDWFLNVGEFSRRTGYFEDIFARTNLVVGQDGRRNGALTVDLKAATFENLVYGRLLISQARGFMETSPNGIWYELIGDRPDFPGGETDVISLNAQVLDFPWGADYLDQNFLITNCYLYSTYASPQICIDPEPFSNSRKVCRADEVRQSSSQGAPVRLSVTNVQNTPLSVVFNIEATNIGNGQVFKETSLPKCNPYHPSKIIGGQDLNIVKLGLVYIGNRRVFCNTDFIRLGESGTGSTTCKYFHNGPVGSSGEITPITIEAWYGYQETELRSVRIQKVG